MNGSTHHLRHRALKALALLGSEPAPIAPNLLLPFPGLPPCESETLPQLWDLLLSKDANEPARLKFSQLLREWDNAAECSWSSGTRRNSDERRAHILRLLDVSPELANQINALVPRYSVEEPVVIALEHERWYPPASLTRSFYWEAYIRYLERKGWRGESVASLANSTHAIVERLADPTAKSAHPTKGLVVGYVQSGKTANFTGVIARAADAGYRLIIVLAGTWNILRTQTQRRLDKELIGRELLDTVKDYSQRPNDWDDFNSHGGVPEALGAYNWDRLTGIDSDYRQLGAAIAALEFYRRDNTRPFHDPVNLLPAPARLIVMKKHKTVLRRLIRDLSGIRTRLADIPTLVIDDESDQAGLNTIDPSKITPGSKARTETNLAIVDLLALFPRGQYVGYTATPYANALVNPDDASDLFPRDYILSLDRPIHYMGVADFFDPLIASDDLPKGDFSHRENAFIRNASSDEEAAPYGDPLHRALACFVLAGAIKLFRCHRDRDRYQFVHHTMLVHTGSQTMRHDDDRDRVVEGFRACAFTTPAGKRRLRELWENDYRPVSLAQGHDEICPTDFAQLEPFVGECLDALGESFVMVLNGNSKDAPDFSERPVWSVFVGGNKLSRGYTIEGLTVSYYRRVANQADTLMQMGRWFGFRKGYRDLVRVFVGRAEGTTQVDLVDRFKQACLMEENFRADIRRYAPMTPRIRPIEIPPLIQLAGDLQPTSRSKMWNSVVKSRNYGGRWAMPTRPTADRRQKTKNEDLFGVLIDGAEEDPRVLSLGGDYLHEDGVKNSKWNAIVWEITGPRLLKFLREYQWLDGALSQDISLQIDFLENRRHGISSWVVIAPQLKGDSFGETWRGRFKVKRRRRLDNGRWQLFGEPLHRAVAEHLVSRTERSLPRLTAANADVKSLVSPRRGVMLAYPVRMKENEPVTIGFELLYPENDLPPGVVLTTRSKSDDAVVKRQS